MNEKKGLSRRDFLKGSVAGVLGLATVGLTGCSQPTAESTVGATTASATQPTESAAAETTAAAADTPVMEPASGGSAEADYEVINTDILVIGTGFGGMAAAYEAVAKGHRVTAIDKGPFRHGGATGFNWDVIVTWAPTEESYKTESVLSQVVDQQMHYNSNVTNPEPRADVMLLNHGQDSVVRNEDGSIKYYVDFPTTRGIEAIFPRHDMDEMAKSPWVTINDRTMITDLLISDGKCLGAIGIYLPTGKMRVYRANATIVATGGTCWMYGWSTVTAQTFNSPDNTGDVDAAAYRHGAGIGDAEFAAYDICTTYPRGLAYGWGTILNADANEWEMIMDKDGNPLFTEETYDVTRFESGDRAFFNQELARLIVEGKGTENRGVLIDISDAPLREAMKKNFKVFERFGIDVTTELLEAAPEMYEHGGTPVIKTNMMSEEIEGAFFVRGAGSTGIQGGGSSRLLYRLGSYAARNAIEYIDSHPVAPDFDHSAVESEYQRLQEILNRNVENSLRPWEVRRKIQNACGNCLGVYREKEKLEEALAELQRIRKEDMARMAPADKSMQYNTDWKEAIENYNLLEISELSVQATLLREESRGAYLRPDFPAQDDENWNCSLIAHKTEDGMQFDKKYWPTLEA